jgi:hypothetical protein
MQSLTPKTSATNIYLFGLLLFALLLRLFPSGGDSFFEPILAAALANFGAYGYGFCFAAAFFCSLFFARQYRPKS